MIPCFRNKPQLSTHRQTLTCVQDTTFTGLHSSKKHSLMTCGGQAIKNCWGTALTSSSTGSFSH